MKGLAYVVVWLVAVFSGSHFVSADIITDWNLAVLEAIRNESTAPPLAARNLAIVHASIFDAVNAIDRQYDAYLFQPNPPSGASAEATAIGAAYESLIHLYPSQQALFNQTLDRTLNSIAPGQSREDGFALGQLVAFLTLAWRSSDGSSTIVPYIPGTDPGDWRRTPPFFRPPELPQWPYVVPFTMTHGAQFRPDGPPPLASAHYTQDFNLTKELGELNSTNRTAEQTLIAHFWADFSFTVTPPGHWNEIAQSVSTNGSNTLIQNARLFALLNLALADAGIAGWDSKYFYDFWRPVTAIREADTDGNPDTQAEPNWTPLLTTPPFPEYTSGHSTFSAAAATVLAEFYGTNHGSFTVGSDTLPGVFRTYDDFEAVAEEIGLSRIYGGIHFLSADLDGLAMGNQLGEFVVGNFLRPVAQPAFLTILLKPDEDWIQVTIEGTSGRAYALELSEDLEHWIPATTNTVPFTFEGSITAPITARYFRALLVD